MSTHAPSSDSTRRRQPSSEGHAGRRRQTSHPAGGTGDEFMGSIVRRKIVTSLPLGNQSEFFANSKPETNPILATISGDQRITPPSTPAVRSRTKTPSFVDGILSRKQVSLDLLSPDQALFFAAPPPEIDAPDVVIEGQEFVPSKSDEVIEEQAPDEVKLFRPLRFTTPTVGAVSRGHGHFGPTQDAAIPGELDDETRMVVERQVEHNRTLRSQMDALYSRLDGVDNEFLQDLRRTQEEIEVDTFFLQTKIAKKTPVATVHEDEEHHEGIEELEKLGDFVEDDYNSGIKRATKRDYYWTALLGLIMLAFTILLCTWKTHEDESALIRSPVGFACVTPCLNQTFLEEDRSTFHAGDVLELIMHLDPHHDESDAHAIVEIIGAETGKIKATVEFGPSDPDRRISHDERVPVDFEDPEEHHIIQVISSNTNTTLSFTLHVAHMTHLAENSVIIAAVILVVVYLFILLEVIHRTLVAIFGSMIALFFVFLMHGGETLSIASIMLFMEWSTLGLLFGMMLIVGELSHTGIFEWFAVRVLVSSKGSYRRLVVLLCGLTAVASAFLDNVTTMLLVAPVTIDMCKILNVDPRPFLIGEVILSNVGGTATLIGDPPNIIIGTSIESIDFVDFIIVIAPCVFFFLIPVTLVMVLWIYNYYFTHFKMPELDIVQLKRTYPIYDEPRLLIAGTVAFFVILSFFLHPVHHKDTAWIALIGALLTITFTNPHDVQDALRNHIEWDTLLFFSGLFVLIEACAEMHLLDAVGDVLSGLISAQPESSQLTIAITLILWVSAIASAFIDNIPWTATMIPIIKILAEELPNLPLETLAWALSLGACLGGNGTLLGASANIVTAGIATNKGYNVSFLNFLYPGFLIMLVTVAISNIYLLVVFVWV